MSYRASWYAMMGPDRKLHTVGVLILGENTLRFFAANGENDPTGLWWNQKLARTLVRMSPSNAFDLLVEDGGNGITNEWSAPFNAVGATPELAAQKLLSELVRDKLGR